MENVPWESCILFTVCSAMKIEDISLHFRIQCSVHVLCILVCIYSAESVSFVFCLMFLDSSTLSKERWHQSCSKALWTALWMLQPDCWGVTRNGSVEQLEIDVTDKEGWHGIDFQTSARGPSIELQVVAMVGVCWDYETMRDLCLAFRYWFVGHRF